MPADQSGSILPTVRYPSFLKSTLVALPITHATTKKHRPTSWELWTIFGSLLGAYILYRAWLYFVYQGGYDSRPAFIKRSQSNTETALPSPPNRYPTLASLRQEQIAAFMPSSYPSTEPVRPSEVSSPPPIYQNAIEEAPVPEYSPAEDNPSPTR
ncbi:unnamed protein product [Umbelopsis sp. WA50703]